MPLVTMPDGQVVDMPENPDPELLMRLRAYQQDIPLAADQGTPAPVAAPDDRNFLQRAWDEVANDPVLGMWGHGLSTMAKGAPETALSVLSSMAANAVGGITAPFVSGGDPEDAANYIRDFAENNTFHPISNAGQQTVEALGEGMQPLANIKQALGEGTLGVTGSPLAATLADMAPDVAATLLGAPKATGAIVRDATELQGRELGNALAGGDVSKIPQQTPVTRARAAGFDIRPSDAERIGVDVPGKFREKLAPTSTQRDMVLSNADDVDKLAGADIGVPEGTRLDDAAFLKVKQPEFDTYKLAESTAKRGPISQEFADLLAAGSKEAFKGSQKGAQHGITEVISALRGKGKKGLQSTSVAEQDYGEALLDMADQIEGKFGEHLKAVGDPEMLTKYQAARERLAKINDVEVATRGGRVDPAIIYKRGQKNGNLTGNLKIISDAHEHFPDVIASPLSGAGKMRHKGIVAGLKDTAVNLASKVPGLGTALDIRSPGFQAKLGTEATPAEASYFSSYGRAPEAAAPKELPELGPQQEMLGSAFEFVQPEGAVGRPPLKPMPMQQVEGLGTALDLERPPGNAPAIPKRDITQQTEEFQPFMDLAPPPGRVGKPKGGVDVRTGTKGAKSKAEIDKLLTLTPEEEDYLRGILGD